MFMRETESVDNGHITWSSYSLFRLAIVIVIVLAGRPYLQDSALGHICLQHRSCPCSHALPTSILSAKSLVVVCNAITWHIGIDIEWKYGRDLNCRKLTVVVHALFQSMEQTQWTNCENIQCYHAQTRQVGVWRNLVPKKSSKLSARRMNVEWIRS